MERWLGKRQRMARKHRLMESWIGQYQGLPRWLGFVGWWLRQRNRVARRHGLLGRRLRLLPWGFRSLGLMETVMSPAISGIKPTSAIILAQSFPDGTLGLGPTEAFR